MPIGATYKHQPARSKAFHEKANLSLTPGYHPGRSHLTCQSCGFILDWQNLFFKSTSHRPLIFRLFNWRKSFIGSSLAYLTYAGVAYVISENGIFVIFKFPVFVVPFSLPSPGAHWKPWIRKCAFVKMCYQVFPVFASELARNIFNCLHDLFLVKKFLVKSISGLQ